MDLLTRFVTASALALVLAAVAGCGGEYSPNTYSATAVQQANKVAQGVVVGVREIKVSASETVGAVAGGAVGAIAGSQVPGSTLGEAFGTVGGTMIGGLVGAGAEHTVRDTKAFEYIVRKGNGDLVSVTQKDEVPLAIGQHVLVIAGSQARIVPDYIVPVDPATQDAPGVAGRSRRGGFFVLLFACLPAQRFFRMNAEIQRSKAFAIKIAQYEVFEP